MAIIVYQSSILKLVGGDDREIILLQQLRSMDCFSCLLIAFPFFQNDCSWDAQSDFAIDASAVVPLLGIALHCRDFVSQEAGRLGPCMRDERLFLRERKT